MGHRCVPVINGVSFPPLLQRGPDGIPCKAFNSGRASTLSSLPKTSVESVGAQAPPCGPQRISPQPSTTGALPRAPAKPAPPAQTVPERPSLIVREQCVIGEEHSDGRSYHSFKVWFGCDQGAPCSSCAYHVKSDTSSFPAFLSKEFALKFLINKGARDFSLFWC